MGMSSTDPFEQANEADVAEQAQDLDGSSAGLSEPDYSDLEADEADVLEQGAGFPEEGDEAYPRAGQDDEQ